MNFEILFKNDLSRKYCEAKSHNQSETAEDGNNGFQKMFLNFSEFFGVQVCVLIQLTTSKFGLDPPGIMRTIGRLFLLKRNASINI